MPRTRAIRAMVFVGLSVVAGLGLTATSLAASSVAVHFFPGSELWTVGCPLAHQCLVGGRSAGSKPMIVPVRDGRPGAEEVLSTRVGNVFALSCPGSMGCVALVNVYEASGQSDIDLVRLRPNGHVVSTQVVASGRRRQLAALSCTSMTRCWIAGTLIQSDVKAPPLVAVWNGVHLTLKTIPVTGSPATWEPKGISCVASTCEIVGFVLGRGTSFAVRTQGGRPSSVQTTKQQIELTDVACPSAERCYASGSNVENGTKGFISTIEGGSLGSPDYGHGVSVLGLGSLTCRGTKCWASGSVANGKTYGGMEGAIYPILSGAPTKAIAAPRTYSLPAISMMGSIVIAAVNTLNTHRCGVVLLG